MKFVLSREKRVWGAPSLGETKGLPFYRDFSSSSKLGSDFHERNVDETFAQSKQRLSARDFHHGKQRVPRSIMFHSFFMKRTCFDHLGTGRSPLRANNGFLRSIMIWVWMWLA